MKVRLFGIVLVIFAVVAVFAQTDPTRTPAVTDKISIGKPVSAAVSVRHLRFSSDGNYLIAQDDAAIFVLTREPFRILFRVDAAKACPAQFTPDNQAMVFYAGVSAEKQSTVLSTSHLRVERWSIAEKRMEQVNEVEVPAGCRQTKLSPNGMVLACVHDNLEGEGLDLLLLDTATGKPIFTNQSFMVPWEFEGGARGNRIQESNQSHHAGNYDPVRRLFWPENGMEMRYSPEGRYFIQAKDKESGSRRIAVDLKTNRQIRLSGALPRVLTSSFAWAGPDRIVGRLAPKAKESVVVEFPSGKILLSGIPTGTGTLSSVGRGDYVIVRPSTGTASAVFDVTNKRFYAGSKTTSIDVFDGTYVIEGAAGELAVYAAPGQPPSARLELPRVADAPKP